jgi:hypothetical protein
MVALPLPAALLTPAPRPANSATMIAAATAPTMPAIGRAAITSRFTLSFPLSRVGRHAVEAAISGGRLR